jgi:putative CocE/NonD family hydrolase
MPAQARSAALFFVLLLALAATSFAADSQDVDFQWEARVPMRDGVSLSATIFRPAGQKEPLPVIFTLTPYIADSYEDRALYFARHGYVYALVDVRGRGNSEGVFDPFAQEARDGYDAVEWLATTPMTCSG